MRVRFLIMDAYSFGGTIRTTLNLAAALTHYHEVEVASVCWRRDEPLIPADPRVRVRRLTDESPAYEARLARRWDPLARHQRRVRESLRAEPSRLIHEKDFRYPTFNGLTDKALGRYLRSLRDGVVIGTRAGLNLAIARRVSPSVVRIGQEHLHHGVYGPEIRRAMRRQLPKLDAYTALTERDAGKWRGMLKDQVRVEAIPNAVPDTGSGVSPLTEKVVLASGRLVRQKGFDRLVPAWRIVADRHPDWRLRIFGSGKDRDVLQASIDAAGLRDSVQLMGFTNTLHDEMRLASIYVMPSRFEGFPMTLLEAMSCGLPPVCFTFPNGAREMVTDGENGLLVKNGDVDGLAKALCRLIEDPDERARLGARAATSVAAYDMENLAQRWHDLLTELARSK